MAQLGMGGRFKVRFPEQASFRAANAIESPTLAIPVINPRRNLISVAEPAAAGSAGGDEPGGTARYLAQSRIAPSEFDKRLSAFAENYGAEIVEDYRYELERPGDDFSFAPGPETPGGEDLDTVLDSIGAHQAWKDSRGAGVVIAIVDTGVDGNRPEFPASKRRGNWSPVGENAWTDYDGHGTMTACIATATRAAGGEFDGVAPDAGLIACRTSFFDSELATIYDYLADYATDTDVPVVASNSFGLQTGSAPSPDPASDFIPALQDAVASGVHVVFSAGNYHQLAGGQPRDCSPTSIWLHKCRDDVLAVATTKTDRSMWFYSSRGPGQHSGESGMSDKPDVSAPTPENGRVLYGSAPQTLPNGWGTSGACPQVAGLAALMVGKTPTLTRQQLFGAIRETARPLGHASTCGGAGQIDCEAAVAAI